MEGAGMLRLSGLSAFGVESDDEESKSSEFSGSSDEDWLAPEGTSARVLRASKQLVDFEALEAGMCNVSLRSEFRVPLAPELRCMRKLKFVVGEGKSFYLFDEEKNAFCLSAKYHDNSFFISQQKTFPDKFWGESPYNNYYGDSFVAVLRLDRRCGVFRLYSNRCEGCDGVLGLHTCGPKPNSSMDRQLLMQVSHSTRPVMNGAEKVVDANVVNVKLPNVYGDLSRDCWCPRFGCGGRAVLESSTYAKPRRKLQRFAGSGRSMPTRKYSSDSTTTVAEETKEEEFERTENEDGVQSTEATLLAGNASLGECAVTTVLPRYDRCSESLKLKFLNRRVKAASSKNFVFALDKNCDNLGNNVNFAEDSENYRVVAQFGKVTDKDYNLDVRFPFSLLQGFAMGISLFDWQAGGDDE